MNNILDRDKERVIKWFSACESRHIYPWEWDFKSSYLELDSMLTYSYYGVKAIQFMLSYELGELNDYGYYFYPIAGKTGINAEASKEAKYIYKVMFDEEDDEILKGLEMNSFIDVFLSAITRSDNRDDVYREIGIDSNIELKDQLEIIKENDNYLKFDLIKNNQTELERFAQLAHSIGNFTILPKDIHQVMKENLSTCWSISMNSLKEEFHSPDEWSHFFNYYGYCGYLDEDYDVNQFYYGNNIDLYPKNTNFTNHQKLSSYLSEVNRRIEHRGIWIVKELYQKLNLEKGEDYEIFLADVEMTPTYTIKPLEEVVIPMETSLEFVVRVLDLPETYELEEAILINRKLSVFFYETLYDLELNNESEFYDEYSDKMLGEIYFIEDILSYVWVTQY